MSNQETRKCPVCGTQAQLSREDRYHTFVECPICGRFEVMDTFFCKDKNYPDDKDKLASYLYYNGAINPPISDSRFFNYIGDKAMFDAQWIEYPWCYHVTKEIVDNWYPKTFSEKVDIFLLGLASRSNFMGELMLFSEEELDSACFVNRHPQGPMKTHPDAIKDQSKYFIDYLVKQEYIQAKVHQCILLPKGMERVDALQRNSANTTKNVFVAMSFAPEMKEVRDAIKNALIECGYTPRIMDEIEHNHQIVPEMLYEIREARFIIAELTGHNNGAYFEAGYALGYGKEVIQVCQKSKFGEDGHFDVKQVNTILWDTTEELTQRLSARIKATIK